jgi:glycosyltransferase involved in cell wall biosynthesis
MTLSFLIPALNEEANIERCLKSIVAHVPRGLSYEIIVGDHGSTDNTRQIAANHGHRVLAVAGGTIGGLRNRLAEVAAGELFVFLDADTSISDAWGREIEAVVTDIQTRGSQVTGSICRAPPSCGPYTTYWFNCAIRNPRLYLGTAHMIVPRRLFLEINGFDEQLRSGEDYDFCQRAVSVAGAEIINRPELCVYHHDYPSTMLDFYVREVWHGEGDFSSAARFLKSRVAQLAVIFASLQIASLSAIFYSVPVAIFLQLVIFTLVLCASFYKFAGLTVKPRIINTAIFYLYLAGRASSIVRKLKF